jgi:cell division protease FtsH
LPSINPKSFNFLSNTKIRDYKILARCQDSDSTEKTSTETEPQNNPPPSPPSSNSGSKQKREKQGKSQWWFSKKQNWKWQPLIQAQEIGVLLLQLGIVMFVMRLLRPGIPLPGSEPRQPTTFVSVPYSEFLGKISSNQVQKVEVDGVHIMFKLKDEGVSGQESSSEVVDSKFQDSECLLRSVTPTMKKILYTTTRPTDIKTPYEKMLENQVEFSSPDKRSGGFLNSALVSFYWKLVMI